MKSYSTFEPVVLAISVMFHVCDAFSRTKRVEMDVMGIEMSLTYGINYNKIVIMTGNMQH